MTTLISIGDIIDLSEKIRLRGLRHLVRRFSCFSSNRIQATWDNVDSPPTNWWNVPLIRRRWNTFISGDTDTDYPTHIMQNHLSGRKGLKMLSPGCGHGSKELRFATFEAFSWIEGFDLSPVSVNAAREAARRAGHGHVRYSVRNTHDFPYGREKWDMVLFDSSLHHIKHLEKVLDAVCDALTPDGILVLNEYVGPNRFQFPKDQLETAIAALKSIPTTRRTRWLTTHVKSNIYQSGILRMVLSDPSEAVRSEAILPEVRKRFRVIEERPYGGNILALVLKDIAHHFLGEDPETAALLDRLFKIEDDYLHDRVSDHVFAVYGQL